ncbi:hypothetical protein ACM64Y_14910 [Novispirillum sp. DQ9]|uniref:hypothetical protein n=1 Tax=Novispirillum sp. DQ9 TaxID=3398612 RepID=UPI003C7D4439
MTKRFTCPECGSTAVDHEDGDVTVYDNRDNLLFSGNLGHDYCTNCGWTRLYGDHEGHHQALMEQSHLSRTQRSLWDDWESQ